MPEPRGVYPARGAERIAGIRAAPASKAALIPCLILYLTRRGNGGSRGSGAVPPLARCAPEKWEKQPSFRHRDQAVLLELQADPKMRLLCPESEPGFPKNGADSPKLPTRILPAVPGKSSQNPGTFPPQTEPGFPKTQKLSQIPPNLNLIPPKTKTGLPHKTRPVFTKTESHLPKVRQIPPNQPDSPKNTQNTPDSPKLS